jgi:predicted small lipoprotein YifL
VSGDNGNMRKALLTVVLVAVAFSLAACSSNQPIPTPSPSDIVGSWKHGGDTVTIDADGTFGISGMPKGVIEQAPVALGAEPAGPAEKVAGTWSIGSGGTDVGGAPGVRLVFQSPTRIGYNTGLTLIVADGSPLRLYVTLGRPDSGIRYTFTRS